MARFAIRLGPNGAVIDMFIVDGDKLKPVLFIGSTENLGGADAPKADRLQIARDAMARVRR